MNDPNEQNDTGIGRGGDELAEILTRLQIYKTALMEIEDMPSQSIWSDDRDDAAQSMVNIASRALKRPEPNAIELGAAARRAGII